MRDKPALFPILVILTLLALRYLAGCDQAPVAEQIDTDPLPPTPMFARTSPPRAEPRSITAGTGLDMPDTCDRLVVVDTPSGPQLEKDRPDWLPHEKERRAHQAEIREVITAVAEEMGADAIAAEFLWRKAISESSGNEGGVHIRSADVEANVTAANKGRRRAAERWRRAKVPVYRRTRKGFRQVGDTDAWALGRGLYGMVTGLYMHRWHADAPPWALCDPVIATVVAVWSIRAGLAECHGTTVRDAFRRFSSGKCAIREDRLERRFDRLAGGRVRGLRLDPIDPESRANFGSRWLSETTDRRELLAAVHRRLAGMRASVAG